MRKKIKKQPDNGEETFQPLSIRLPVDLLTDLKGFAKLEHRELAPYVRIVLQEHRASRLEIISKTA